MVGGGPAGSTTAFYTSKGGLKVLLAEKDNYPKDKICGDMVSPTVHDILQEMGVLNDFIREGIGRWITSRGLVSPCGNSFVADVGKSHDISVQRYLLDYRMQLAAQKSGVDCKKLKVLSLTKPSELNGYWTISCLDENGEEEEYFSR